MCRRGPSVTSCGISCETTTCYNTVVDLGELPQDWVIVHLPLKSYIPSSVEYHSHCCQSLSLTLEIHKPYEHFDLKEQLRIQGTDMSEIRTTGQQGYCYFSSNKAFSDSVVDDK